MKIDTKMEELMSAAIATRDARMAAFTAYSAACVASDDAWDAFNAANEAARRDADAPYTYGACGD